jgi:hypothetical protein
MQEERGPFGEIILTTTPADAVPIVYPLDVGPSLAVPPAPPVSAGSIVSRTFLVWSRNVWRFAGYGLLTTVPVLLVLMAVGVGAVLVAFSAVRDAGPPSPGVLVGFALLVVPAVTASSVALLGGLSYGAVQTLSGRPLRFGTMVAFGLRRLLPTAGAFLLATLVIGLGLLAFIVPGVILACGLAGTIPAAVAERLGPVAALRRSWRLTSGHRWSIFLAALLMIAVAFGLGLLGLVLQLFPLVGPLAAFFVNLTTSALFNVWPAVAYHDLRVQKEGTTTDELVRVFE